MANLFDGLDQTHIFTLRISGHHLWGVYYETLLHVSFHLNHPSVELGEVLLFKDFAQIIWLLAAVAVLIVWHAAFSVEVSCRLAAVWYRAKAPLACQAAEWHLARALRYCRLLLLLHVLGRDRIEADFVEIVERVVEERFLLLDAQWFVLQEI